MMGKVKTLFSVLKTFGFSEFTRLIFRKIIHSIPSSLPFDSRINWGKAEYFLEQNQLVLEEFGSGIDSVAKFRTGFFNSIYDLGPELSQILNALVATTKPTLIVETGVAAGASTNLILEQFRKNSQGKLVSIDITPHVGELVADENKSRWDLQILPKLFRRRHFRSILKRNSKANIFLHDSDHSAKWQFFEILVALELLPNLSFLLVDDIQVDVCNYLISQFGLEKCYFLNEENRKKSLVLKID